MATGSGDEMEAAGRGHLRTSHADREHAIEMLKAAYVAGMLGKDELDARVGRALTARTRADLAAITADIPPGTPATRPERPPARVRRRPLARAAAGSGGCLVIASAAMELHRLADPGNTPGTLPGSVALPSALVALTAIFAALFIVIYGAATAVEQRRSRRQLPPRPGPGGHATDGQRHRGTGHGPAPRGHGDGQARAGLRGCKPWQDRQHTSPRASRAPRGARPAPGAV